MAKQRVPLYLAHASCSYKARETIEAPVGELNSIEPYEAASYIADLLGSVRVIAMKARLEILSDLIEVAQEEAKLHCRRR